LIFDGLHGVLSQKIEFFELDEVQKKGIEITKIGQVWTEMDDLKMKIIEGSVVFISSPFERFTKSKPFQIPF
jgi:hypothetical protein